MASSVYRTDATRSFNTCADGSDPARDERVPAAVRPLLLPLLLPPWWCDACAAGAGACRRASRLSRSCDELFLSWALLCSCPMFTPPLAGCLRLTPRTGSEDRYDDEPPGAVAMVAAGSHASAGAERSRVLWMCSLACSKHSHR